MPLTDHTATPTPIRGINPNTSCSIGRALLALTAEDAEELNHRLNESPPNGSRNGWTARTIADTTNQCLDQEYPGVTVRVSVPQVGRHRLGGCSCATR